ncbi:MAG: iron-sulfur cluster assembly scaffold protein [Caldisericota bacterium]|jgi:nitrogen fixation NifU-like protein|nr:iron-sulfur cluster assembly scaffold protein [Caldisericota bacterium]
MDKYSRATIREFMNPSNIGSIDAPSGIGHIADEVDAVELTVHISAASGRIVEMKYRIAGCTALIAALSVLSKLVPGKTIDEASAIDMQVVSGLLDGLPESKWRCAGYAVQALHLAIEDYQRTTS